MLLQARADSNLTSTSLQYTALEWAVQRNPTSKAIKSSHYTIYSPATYVRHTIPISIFSFEKVGLMIYPTDDQIPYWFDGHQ